MEEFVAYQKDSWANGSNNGQLRTCNRCHPCPEQCSASNLV